ncbi:hypothetical protein ACJIZ3_009040 [Penstemon smallii]|uniref:Uncharacterized protein n=1 Tax=Penstemon smallii TaxID=265156 RepID=A0ABD3TBI0_9LAMI
MEFIDCKVPYPSLYMIKKDETDKTKGTTLTVYQPAIGQSAPEYTLSKEPHSSKVSLEVLRMFVYSLRPRLSIRKCVFCSLMHLTEVHHPVSRTLFVHRLHGGHYGTLQHRNFLMFQVTGSGLKMSLQRGIRISIELGYMMQFWLLCTLTTRAPCALLTTMSSAPFATYGVHPPIRSTRQLGNYLFLLPNGTSKPEVQATKLKINVVESSTSESDSHRDHHWKRSKKIQVACEYQKSKGPRSVLKGQRCEAPNDSTHSSSSVTKEIDDDSDRLPLTQVLASCKGKARSSKIPLHLPHFSNHGVQQADLTSSRSENVVIAFEPLVRTSLSSISTFRCDEVVAHSKRKMVEIMWDNLFQQVSTTSFDGLHFIKEEVNGILQAISQYGGIDVTSLHGRVNDFLRNANQYVKTQLLSQKRKVLFDQQISGANQHLQDMQLQESQHAIHARDLEVKLTELVEKEDNLKKQLEEIANQKEEIGLLLQEDEKQLLDTQSAISRIENKVSILESNPPLSEDDFVRQTNLKKELEANLQDLKNFKLFS